MIWIVLAIILLLVVALFMVAFFVVKQKITFKAELNRSLNSTLVAIRMVKPTPDGNVNEKEEIARMEQFLTSVSNLPKPSGFFSRMIYGNPTITFEMSVPSDSERINFYLLMPTKFRSIIEKQIHSFFPDAGIEEVEDYTIFRPECRTTASFLKLKKNQALPFLTYQHLETDPLHNLANSLSKLDAVEEGASIQIILKRSMSNRFRKKASDIAHRMQQGYRLKDAIKGMPKKKKDPEKAPETFSLTPEEQEVIKQLETKANKMHFDVNIRLLASAKTQERSEMILTELESAFSQFEDSNLNTFKFVRGRNNQNAHKLAYDFVFRVFRNRQKITLDSEEVSSVFHLPISTTSTPRINWLKSKSAAPPDNVPKEGLLVGFNEFRGIKTDIRLTKNDRRRHLYIIGQTGTGKSGFIEELAKQDAVADGCCIIDPHGDLVEHVMDCIPPERAGDVIYFDPADLERPMSFNIMEYDPAKPEQKTFLVNEFLGILDKLYDMSTSGGPMFEQYMRNAMLLVMDSPELGNTLLEIPRVFRDPDYRRKKLAVCKDITVVDFWQKEAEKAGGDASLENITPYINSKLTTFISNDFMRPIITQQESSFNFREMMDSQKIFMVNLSKGKIGDINAHLLGMIIVGRILMASLSRTDTAEEDRKDFYLYIDEFQNFTTDSITTILSEARKYRLSLNIAHQFIGQLSDDIKNSVFGNVGSMCAFRVGSEDGEFLEKQFAPNFSASDLINVDNFNCFCKLLVNNQSAPPFNMKTYPPRSGNPEVRHWIIENSRQIYGRDRDEIEKEVTQRGGFEIIEEIKQTPPENPVSPMI